MISKTILHYRIVEKLGQGGMGVVYKAEDTKLKREVAIKFFPRQIAASDEERKRFKIEAQAAAALNHPNIATIHAIEEVDDEMFIVMEYIGEWELKSTIDDRQLSIDDVLNYATQIAEGLQAAHEKGIWHRDIKSSNIMITDKGLVKIMDFGLAKLAGQSKLTKTGTTMGTMAYISPEQLQGQDVDQRTDIWAFGVVLYELLTGRLPFKGEYEQAVMYSILNEEPEPLDGLRPDLPPGLSNIVRKSLEKDPEARYHSLQDIIVDFREALNVGAETTKFNYGTAPALRKPAPTTQDGRITTKGERRQVAILVASLTGYDNLVENLETEDLNEVMNALGSKVAEIVTEREGLVNEFSEDEIALLFGMPVTHEDDLRRAVGAALELHEFISQLNEELSEKIEEEIRVHSGIDAGLVVVQPRDGTNRRFKLTGETTQIASKLAAEANEDEILISSESQRLIQPFFECEPCGESITIRGKAQPLTPFVIKGESGFSTRFEAIESESLTSFTGREKELDLLRSDFKKAVNGDGQFVTIIAEAGLGKSRLLYEFKNQLDGDVDIIQASCQSNTGNMPYFPFVALLRDLLDIGADEDAQNQAETVVSRILAVDPHLEVYIPLFLQLLSIDCAKYPLPDHLESGDIQQAIAEGISAILTITASKKPMVIFLEDWHWVDEASQNVLKQLAEMIANFPLLLVVTCRPEGGLDWGNPANHTQIQLAPLEASHTAAIIKSILAAESVPDELAALIHERTGGNPFFVEELSQTLHEGGAIKVEDRKITLTDSKSQIHLPHTIQAVIRSRLDRLDADSLEVLRVASVIGREFTANILWKALTEQFGLDKSVKTLRELGMIQQVRVLPEATFRFKHALTQEVAYDSLLKRQRKALHGVISEALEQSYGDRLEEHAILLMDHFGNAENWQKAIHYGRTAADVQMMKSFSVVLNILEKVEQWLAKLPENPEREATRIDVLLKMERTCESLGYVQRQKEIIDRLLTLIETDDINRVEVYIRLGDLLVLSNRLDEAEDALKEAHRLSKELGDEDSELRVMRSMGYLNVNRGRDDEAAVIMQQVVNKSVEKGIPKILVQNLTSLFTLLMRLGEFEEAKKCVDDALELYDQVSHRQKTYINFMAGSYYRHTGDYEKAISHFTTLVHIWEEGGYGGRPATGLLPLADIYMIQGNVEEALRCYEKAVDMSRNRKIASELAMALNAMGRGLMALKRNSEALPRLEEAGAVFRQLQDSENEKRVLATLATALENEGRYQDAFSRWESVQRMGEATGDLKTELDAVKGMARTTRHLAEQPSEALKFYQEAYALAQQIEDLDEQSDLLNTLGIIHWQSGNYDAALQHYEKALQIFLEKDDQTHASLMLNSMAKTLLKLDRHKEALARLAEALEIHEQIDQPLLQGHAFAIQGDIYLDSQELNQARENYEKSLALRQKIGDRKGEGWMACRVAKVCQQMRQAKDSHDYAEKALAIAKECHDVQLVNEAQSHLEQLPQA